MKNYTLTEIENHITGIYEGSTADIAHNVAVLENTSEAHALGMILKSKANIIMGAHDNKGYIFFTKNNVEWGGFTVKAKNHTEVQEVLLAIHNYDK